MNIEKQTEAIEAILFDADLEEDDAPHWVFHRFTPKDVEGWLALGINDADTAAALDRMGIMRTTLDRGRAEATRNRLRQ